VSKRLVALTLALALVISTMITGLANVITVNIDGDDVEFDVPPMIVDSRTLVPMRAIFEDLGATVGWNEALKEATGTKGDTVVKLVIDSKIAIVNGEEVELDAPAIVEDFRTLVPLRFISDVFGYDVVWHKEYRDIDIISPEMKHVRLVTSEFLAGLAETNPMLSFRATGIETELEEEADDLFILDVRNKEEYETSHIIGSYHMEFQDLAEHMDKLPKDMRIAVISSYGQDSGLVATALYLAGFELVGSMSSGIATFTNEDYLEEGEGLSLADLEIVSEPADELEEIMWNAVAKFFAAAGPTAEDFNNHYIHYDDLYEGLYSDPDAYFLMDRLSEASYTDTRIPFSVHMPDWEEYAAAVSTRGIIKANTDRALVSS
jgi:rhodanese-related sulfurtransferase